MNLFEIGFSGKKAEAVKRHGANTAEGFLSIKPLRYYDFSITYPLVYEILKDKIESKTPVAIIGKVTEVANEYKRETKRSIIKIRVKEEQTGKTLYVNCIGMYNMLTHFRNCIDDKIIIGGKIEYEKEHGWFSMMNPVLFSPNIDLNKKIIPVNSKYKGISDQAYTEALRKALKGTKENALQVPSEANIFKLPSLWDAWNVIHNPTDIQEIEKANQKLVFDDMLYFASKLEMQKNEIKIPSPYKITTEEKYNELIANLPYTLTPSQKAAIECMKETSKNGERISALIQGDVGSGKTIVALSMIVLFAESGYQSVLMAPTTVLAAQHYKDIKEQCDSLGLEVALLSNEMKASERKEVLQRIKNHEVDIIVGTHACISPSVEYNNLGFVCTDEEHKFGVLQRQALLDKGEQGVHTITMSGTPIPRTLADALYGNSMTVYTLTPPAERMPVQTAIAKNDATFFEFIENQLISGHQAYVVCPLIEENENNTVSSIEKTYVKYKNYFEKKGFTIAAITGKTNKAEQSRIMEDYKSGKTQILIATTVIEVGVNNPNATVIVITGAERFGLSTLHQLRGRVGRGNLKSYCILQPSEGYEATTNLNILVSETNGYKVAIEDLKHRGSGNIIGDEQSGKNIYIEQMLSYPEMFKKVQEIAKRVVAVDKADSYIQNYEKTYGIIA